MAEDEGFVDLMKATRLPVEEVQYIKENPEGLTKEGCEYSIKLWNMSHNRYQKAKFKMMLEKCKTFTPSGKTEDDKTILARKDGKISWTEKLD